jgi:hypothetical protein
MGVLQRGQFVCAREGESGNPQLEHLIVINSHFLYWPNDPSLLSTNNLSASKSGFTEWAIGRFLDRSDWHNYNDSA